MPPVGRCRTCSAARCATRSRSARTCSTSGPPIPAANRTAGARHSIRTPSWRRPGGSSTNTASPQSNSRVGCFRPRRRWPRSRRCGPRSRTTRCGSTRTPRGRRRRRSRWRRVWPGCWSTSRTPRPTWTAWPRSRGRRRCRWRPTCAWWRSISWRPRSRNSLSRVVLSDHHYWGGLQRSRLLAGICDNFGLGLSMHSNSHLGISLAAMVHLAGGDAEPHVRVRHPLAVEDRGGRQAGRARVRRRVGAGADDTGAGRADRRGATRRTARAVPALRHPRPRRHRLHAQHRPGLRGDQPALVVRPPLH